MVFVIECASYFTYRDETCIFVIDVHLFYDEIVVVIEVYSFYDEIFSSLIYPFFVMTFRLLGGQTTSTTLATDVSCPRGASTLQVTCPTTWQLTWPVMWMVHVSTFYWATRLAVIGSHFGH